MADIHLKTGGANSSPFATWANAATTLVGSVAAVAAGDNIYVSSAHAESSAGITVTVPGTAALPTRLICGTESGGSGISAVSTGAVIESSTTVYAVSGNFYAEGITFRASSASAIQMNFSATGNNIQYFKSCRFEVTGGHASAAVKFGTLSGSSASIVTAKNCTFKFGAAAQRIMVDYNLRMSGGGLDAAGVAVSGIFSLASSSRACAIYVDDFDASSGLTASGSLISTLASAACYAEFKRLKLPASWTGTPVIAGQLRAGDRVVVADASSGATLIKLWIADYAGSVRDESTVKVTAQTRSYKMASAAECSIANPLKSQDYYVPLSGAAQTLTLDICTDGVTLTDQEAYIEVDYFATSGSLLGSVVSDAAASIIATGANQTTSATAWTTTGLTTPIRQALSVAVTAGSASYAIARVVLVKPSATVYVADTVTVA